MASESGTKKKETLRSIQAGTEDASARNGSSTASSSRMRGASTKFLESSPPVGMWNATGTVLAQAPTPADLRRGSLSHDGWDGPTQRRNSAIREESMKRMSRTPSAQTPASLQRQTTNFMGAHAKGADEGEPFPKSTKQGKMSEKALTARPTKAPQRPINAGDDDDDPFSKFMGLGRFDSQEYVPKRKAAPLNVARPEGTHDPYAIPHDDSNFVDPEAPVGKKKLPNNFLYTKGQSVPRPFPKPEKLTIITTDTARPSSSSSASKEQGPDKDGIYPNGYKFPPKHSWGEATIIGLKAFWRFTLTPLGFFVVLYGLNVVAWGGMLFLLLIGGGNEYMCYPPGSRGEKDCNNINSPRRIWIEIDSQILNALFCVTGFGLIPWRFRDLYYLLKFRLRKDHSALRRLAGIHRSWFRLQGSQGLPIHPAAEIDDPEHNPAIPLPPSKIPDLPLTGVRAPATRLWKLDYFVWAFVLNTFLQAVLSGFMWGLNRYDRPSWSTGTFVALACIVAGLGGLMSFQEGKRIKNVEGMLVKEEEMLRDLERNLAGGREKKKGRRYRKSKVGMEAEKKSSSLDGGVE